MRIIFFGAPGVGKGTQSQKLADKHDLAHFSTGDLFRASIRAHTRIGDTAKRYIDRGELVPDEITWQILEPSLEKVQYRDFVLDGYPRTIPQAEQLLEELHQRPTDADPIVISLEVPEEEIVRRISRRRIHPATNAVYHLDFNPPPRNIPLGDLLQRVDDKPRMVRRRLAVYEATTAPLKAFFSERGLLHTIDGRGTIEEVFGRIEKALQSTAVAS